jgi:hypothetical protein
VPDAGERVQTTDGKWITHPPARCPNGHTLGPTAVEETVMIARVWQGWVRTEQANAYVDYITRTGLRDFAPRQAGKGNGVPPVRTKSAMPVVLRRRT